MYRIDRIDCIKIFTTFCLFAVIACISGARAEELKTVQGAYVGEVKVVKVESVLKRRNSSIFCSASTVPFTIGYIVSQRGKKVIVRNAYFEVLYKGRVNRRGFSGQGADDSSLVITLTKEDKAKVEFTRIVKFPSGNLCKMKYSGKVNFYEGLQFIPIAD